MFSKRTNPVLGFALAMLVCPIPCDAYVQWMHIPLIAHRGHAGAKGTVKFSESFGETKHADGATLTIEVDNVPLPPGTQLVVEVHEKEVGTITLDSRRRGRLVLESGYKSSVPRIAAGSIVTVRLPAGGGTVLW